MEFIYTQNRDYFIPDIVLKEKQHKPLGKYGRMRKDYLKKPSTSTIEPTAYEK